MKYFLVSLLLSLFVGIGNCYDGAYYYQMTQSNAYEVCVNTATLATATSAQFFVNLASGTITKGITGRFEINVASTAVISLYRSPVYISTGTALGVYNKNYSSSKTSQAGLVFSGNIGGISNTGTTVYRVRTAGTPNVNPIKIDSRFFPAGSSYVLDINNISGAGTPISVKFEFFE